MNLTYIAVYFGKTRRGYQQWSITVMLTLITVAATQIMPMLPAIKATQVIVRTTITGEKIFKRGNLVNKISLPTGRITGGNIRIELIIPAMQVVLIILEILAARTIQLGKIATKKKIAIREALIPIRIMRLQDKTIPREIIAEQKLKRLLMILRLILPELKRK